MFVLYALVFFNLITSRFYCELGIHDLQMCTERTPECVTPDYKTTVNPLVFSFALHKNIYE